MKIILNGQATEVSDAQKQTLQGLVERGAMKPDRVAIEHNGEIVPRSQWPAITLQPEDRVEIVHFVGGGLR